MPFIAKHVRLTNSGKLPDVFLTSKVQAPTDLADAKLGKLYFVLQINAPWNHVATIGSSIINVVSREYYRQEGHIPLENFERAIAKANRLIDQLSRDGESTLKENFHALIALAVGDELHIAHAGEAEAYFYRDEKLNQIIEPRPIKNETGQVFNNLITGEISAHDKVVLGNPGLYGAVTTDELERLLTHPLQDAALRLAKQLKAAKIRKANAIIIDFQTVRSTENSVISNHTETLYLDQRLESTWTVLNYHVALLARPILSGVKKLSKLVAHSASRASQKTGATWREKAQPKLKKFVSETSPALSQRSKQVVAERLSRIQELQPNLPKLSGLPKLGGVKETAEAGVPVHHYTSRRVGRSLPYVALMAFPLRVCQEIGQQFRHSIRRSPRTWYMIVALLLLASIGASIQTRKLQNKEKPIVNSTTVEEMKSLLDKAKQAKVYGNLSQARQAYLDALAKGELIKQNQKLAEQNQSLIATAYSDYLGLAGASELTAPSPLLTLQHDATHGLVHEGTLYYVTRDGQLFSLLLTGGDPTSLGELPNNQAAIQLAYDATNRKLFLQTYTGTIYNYDLTSGTLKESELAEETFPVSTGIGFFNGTLYLTDPAASQIWKYTPTDTGFAAAAPYLRSKETDLSDATSLAIDGSLFTLHKSGIVQKFTRGNATNFTVTGIPEPLNTIKQPLGFFADEDSDIYYLADRGGDAIQPRLIEFDSNGKFTHQYFLPSKWRKDIRLVIGNPKSHKAWVLVNKELYEFTLVQ